MPQLTINAAQNKIDRIIPALEARRPQDEDSKIPSVPIGDGERIKRFIRYCLRKEVYAYEHEEAGKIVVSDNDIVTW